jgi:hypothetical protein
MLKIKWEEKTGYGNGVDCSFCKGHIKASINWTTYAKSDSEDVTKYRWTATVRSAREFSKKFERKDEAQKWCEDAIYQIASLIQKELETSSDDEKSDEGK